MTQAGDARLPLRDYLRSCGRGLGSLPGTAAEIWTTRSGGHLPRQGHHVRVAEVARTAHSLGLRSTAHIMFACRGPAHWARHLLAARPAGRAGGFTEFVPLPFVHMEAPMYPAARRGAALDLPGGAADARLARLARTRMSRISRTSWVKMGPEGAKHALQAVPTTRRHADELEHQPRRRHPARQEFPPEAMEALIRGIGACAAADTPLRHAAEGSGVHPSSSELARVLQTAPRKKMHA